MLSIRSSADMARAMAGPLDAGLRDLLQTRVEQLSEYDGYDLGELVHIIVARPGDTLEAIQAEAGVSLVTDPPFEFVERHGVWLEAVVILSDDGFGVAIFAPDCVTIDAQLIGLLRAHA